MRLINNDGPMLRKKIVIELPFVYTINEFSLGNKHFIAAGSEKNYPAYLIDHENNEKVKVTDGPGGMMSIVPIPGHDDGLISVMGLFPPFIGFEAGVYIHRKNNENWETQKIITLPFSHRCEILTVKGINHLFIATVGRNKKNPSDWSNPGELHHVKIENGNWSTEVILGNLTRNHGMVKSVISNVETICVSGAEGIFAINPDNKKNWKITHLFEHEVSEFAFCDINNDGEDELVTIEPFHGETLNVYKGRNGKWGLIYSSPLSFGHGLSVGKFHGQNIVVVGNRRDSGDLELHKILSGNKSEKIIIENNVGPTQTKVYRHEGIDFILSSNQIRNEVALYY